ncbi:GNAT family N-acetyltransferase [Micromonospora inyonensis]|uniref:Acetyltransferase (GNAT) family protein n=1 Tax=Micromonospora inyonensis TaxID=47866 RepID=A0A1C6SP71_9ACTN|nr:GNAT family N-acetyltransferase [Micromonospora inyonensis]SCL31396.1 Acetyltransferase (GNAT) family protein [Micromonospora inyonensis]
MDEDRLIRTAVRVRRGKLADADVLGELNGLVQQLHSDAEPAEFKAPDAAAAAEFFRGQLQRADMVILLAELGDHVVGYLTAEETRRRDNPFTEAFGMLYIHHLAVAESARRRGVGRALMAAAEEEARRRGLKDLRLDFWSFNEAAGRFFQEHGFDAYNIRMRRAIS